MGDFANFAAANGLKRRNLLIRQSTELLRKYITTQVLLGLYDSAEAIRYENQNDPCVEQALRLMRDGRTLPEAPRTAAVMNFALPEFGGFSDFRTWQHISEVRTRAFLFHPFSYLAVCPEKRMPCANA